MKSLTEGWYHHKNAKGHEEIVYLKRSAFTGTMVVYKISGQKYLLSYDKGTFGKRIALPIEE